MLKLFYLFILYFGAKPGNLVLTLCSQITPSGAEDHMGCKESDPGWFQAKLLLTHWTIPSAQEF